MLFGNNKKNAEYIVDVHCHIMPGIDDGSRDITETLEMLKIAQSEGITHMIATPHFKSGHRNASPQNVRNLFNLLERKQPHREQILSFTRAMRFCFMMRCVRNLIMEG